VCVLAGLLRVAIGLDRNHAARVASLAVEEAGDRLVVAVTPMPGEDISLELYAAGTRAGLLRATLDLEVDFAEA
jgi:hypothetical protein